MNGMPFGRFLSLAFLLVGGPLLGISVLILYTSDVYYPKIVSVEFEIFILGVAMFIVPGVYDLRYESSDSKSAWIDKGDIWLVEIQKSRWVLSFYGLIVLSGEVMYPGPPGPVAVG